MARNLQLARLFYDIEADAKGLDAELGKAEKSFGRLSDFIKKNPMAAAGALGAAAVTAAFQLAKMAEETNRALGIIADRVPDAAGKVDELRRAVDSMAIQYGIAQDKVIATMDAVSQAGVRNTDELIVVTQAAVRAGRATGDEAVALVGGIDAVLDIFGLSARDAASATEQLFAAAQGKTSLNDLLDTMQKLAPKIQGTGLDFLTTSRAMAVLIDQGFEPGKKVIAEFGDRLLTGGVAAIQALAVSAPPASAAVDDFTAAIERNSSSIEANVTRNQASLRAALVELGSHLEPLGQLATKTLFYALGGGWRENRIRMEEAARQAADTGNSLERLAVAGGVAAGAAGALTGALIEARGAASALAGVGIEELKEYRRALQAVIGTEQESTADKTTLIAVERELAKRREEGARVARAAAEETARAAREAADEYAAAMKKIQDALIASTVTLVDDTESAIRTLRDELVKGKVSAEDLERGLRPLEDRLRRLQVVEEFDLDGILERSRTAINDIDLEALLRARQALMDVASAQQDGSQEQAATNRQVRELEGLMQGRSKDARLLATELGLAAPPLQEATGKAAMFGKELEKGKVEAETTTEKARGLTDEVRRVAEGAIGVAEGFGLIDSQAASALKSVVGIADSLPAALSGSPDAIFAVLGGLTGVIGSLFGGDSAEERARKELLRKNTAALTDLVRVNGNLLRVSTPGFKLAGAQEALDGILGSEAFASLEVGSRSDARLRKLAQEAITVILRNALQGQGLTLGDLDDVAADLGIDIRDKSGGFDFGGIRQLLDALKSGQFTKFADEIQEQFERIQNAIELGLIDPADELAEVIKVLSRPELGKNVPAIAEAFKGLDLSTDAGRAAGIKKIQDLFTALGDGSISEASFGGLNGQEFRDLLVKLFGLLGGKPIEAAVGKDQSEPARDEPTVLPVSGSAGNLIARGGTGLTPAPDLLPAAATLDDLLGVSEETNLILDKILGTLGRDPGPLPPIHLPAGWQTQTGPVAGSTVTFGDFTVNVTVAGTSASGLDIAQATAEGVRAAIDSYLAEALARQRAIRGDGGLG